MNEGNKISVWLHLCRIWSLTATVAPVALMACANAPGQVNPMSRGAFFLNVALALVSCGCLQVACNLLNTWGDFRSGVDTAERRPTRAELVDGVVTPGQVGWAAVGFVAAGALAGGALVARCWSWGLAVCAAIGILGALNYSTGIRFKYRGLGVPFVFLLMGVLLMLAADACFGGGLARAWGLGWPRRLAVLLILLPVSCLVAAILHANDMRDIEDDAAAGIVTPSTISGPRGAFVLFGVLHLLPYVAPAGMFLLDRKCGWPFLLQFALLPLTARVLREARRGLDVKPHQRSWAGLLSQTARLHLLTSAAQCAGFLLMAKS